MQEAAVVVNVADHALPRPISIQSIKPVPPKPSGSISLPRYRPKPPSSALTKPSPDHYSTPSPKKPRVPRLSHRPKPPALVLPTPPEPVAKEADPLTTERVKRIMRESVRSTLEEQEKKQAEEKTRREEMERKRAALEQRAKEIRDMNSKAAKLVFSPKYAWGVNPARPQDSPEWRMEVLQEKQRRAQLRAKSLEQTEELRRIHHLIRQQSRPQIPSEPAESSDSSVLRTPQQPEIQGFMKRQQAKRREQSLDEELARMADEAKRVTRLKMLEAKEKRRLEAHKRKRNKGEKTGKRKKGRRKSRTASGVSEGREEMFESSSSGSALASQKELLQTLLRRREKSSTSSRNSAVLSDPAEDPRSLQRTIEANERKLEEFRKRIEGIRSQAYIEEDSEENSLQESMEEKVVRVQAVARAFLAKQVYYGLLEDQDHDSLLSELHDLTPKHSLSFDHLSAPTAGQHLSPREIQAHLDKEAHNLHLNLAAEQRVSLQRSHLSMDANSVLQASRQEDQAQFSALVREICGSQEALAEEIRKAYESMLEKRYDQLQQLFIPPEKPETHSPAGSSLDERIENAIGTATTKAIELETEQELAKIRETAELHADSPQVRPENPLCFMEADSPEPGERLEEPAGVRTPPWNYQPVTMNAQEMLILERLKDADLSPGHTPSPEVKRDQLVFSPSNQLVSSKPSPQVVDQVTDFLLSLLLQEIQDLQVTEARAAEFDSIPRHSISSEALLREQEELRQECAVRTDDESVWELVSEMLDVCDEEVRKMLPKALLRSPVSVLARLQAVDLGLFPRDPMPLDILPRSKLSQVEQGRNYDGLLHAPPTLRQICLDSHQIHNRLVFEAANEAVSIWRKYGSKGVPMPWSAAPRVVTQVVRPEEVKILATRLVCTWNATRMGQIPREAESQSEELVQLQREERLVLDIIGETLRTDEQWCDYEDEETQVKLDLADMTLEMLMSETLSLLYALS